MKIIDFVQLSAEISSGSFLELRFACAGALKAFLGSPDAHLGSPGARVSLAQVHSKLSLGLLMLSWDLLRLSWGLLFARTGALKAPDALLGSPGALVVPPVPPFFPPWALGSVELNHKATGLQGGSAGIAKRLQLAPSEPLWGALGRPEAVL